MEANQKTFLEVVICCGCAHDMLSEFCEDCYLAAEDLKNGEDNPAKLCEPCGEIFLRYAELHMDVN